MLIKKATLVISDFGSVSLLIIGSFSSSRISEIFIDCQTSCVEQLKLKYLVFMPRNPVVAVLNQSTKKLS